MNLEIYVTKDIAQHLVTYSINKSAKGVKL